MIVWQCWVRIEKFGGRFLYKRMAVRFGFASHEYLQWTISNRLADSSRTAIEAHKRCCKRLALLFEYIECPSSLVVSPLTIDAYTF